LTYHLYKRTIRIGIIVVTLSIVSLILWNTFTFFQVFKDEQRTKMEVLAAAYKRLSRPDLNAELSLEQKILESNTNIPMILTDAEGNIIQNTNLNLPKTNTEHYLVEQLAIMKRQNKPFKIHYKNTVPQYIYYKDSKILTNLKYYPLALILVLILFFLVIYLFTKSSRVATENILWTGMAKETAHQIGTPLSSLLGWVAILKEDKQQQKIADEIEKDVNRLEIIANRFSKIGSKNALKSQDVVALTQKSYNYLASRSSKKIDFKFSSDATTILTPINAELYSWVIENLVKNAIDAMQGEGRLNLQIKHTESNVNILLSDTGKGISKALFKTIFEPGYTTKKRGWGLGLSLAKRIVEDFHKGKIYVKESKIESGSTFCVSLNR